MNPLKVSKLLADEYNVKILTNTRICEIFDEGVIISNKYVNRMEIKAETIILALGLKPENSLLKIVRDRLPEVYAIGDCVEPRKIIDAIWEGFHKTRVI